MKLQVQPNRWTCLPTAFAIALNVRVEFIIRWIGHDGSTIIYPDLPEPENRRGFHPQELIDYTWWRGYAVTPIEAYPRSFVDSKHEPYKVEFATDNQTRLLSMLHQNIGVLTGQTVATKQHHSVAWNGYSGKVFNPAGTIQSLEDFAINTFWLITERG